MELQKISEHIIDRGIFFNYFHFINKLIFDNDIDLSDGKHITDLQEFRNFRLENPICIRDAQLIDMLFFNKCGRFWLTAYRYPKEYELLLKGNGIAENIGILTFDINCNL